MAGGSDGEDDGERKIKRGMGREKGEGTEDEGEEGRVSEKEER